MKKIFDKESITMREAKDATAFGVKKYDWGHPKRTYVDIHVQDSRDNGEMFYRTETYLLKAEI